jgi:hypothetical protein
MKRWLTKATLLAAIAFPTVSGAAWAGDGDDFGCSNATLKGAYALSVLNIATPTGPGVVMALGTFDGKGGYTQTDYPGDGLRTMGLTEFRTDQTGTYMVNPDCTGFMTINLGAAVGVVQSAFVISNGGRAIDGVVGEFTVGGTAVPIQSSFHYSKVRPEQND